MRITKNLELSQHESSLKLIEHSTRNKFLILKNNMKLLLFLHLLPVSSIIFSVSYHKWFQHLLSSEVAETEIWLSLFSVFLPKTGEIYTIEYFRLFLCELYAKNEKNCFFLKNFRFAGVISSLFIAIGVLADFYLIFQLVLILLDKYNALKPKLCLKLRKLQIITFFLYFVGFFIWVIGSGVLNLPLRNLGICFYANFGGIALYAALMGYFSHLKRKIKERIRISAYLMGI